VKKELITIVLLGFAVLCVFPALLAREADSSMEREWPGWRGPLDTGVAPHGNPPVEWSEEKNIRWKIEIPGMGHATPIVWDDRIFILTAVETDEVVESAGAEPEEPSSSGRRRRMRSPKPKNVYEFLVLAVSRKDGRVIWRKTAARELPHEGMHRDGSMASNSPVTDGKHLYAYFGSRGIHCFDMNGKLKWKKDLGDKSVANCFGEGNSPALHGDTLVVNWDHEGDSFIVALDKKTGKEIWRKNRDERTSWSSPVVVENGGKAQVVVTATNRVRGYDLKNGEVIWECGGMTRNCVPCPVAADGLVDVMSGFRGSALLAIRLDQAKKDITGTDAIAWSHDRNTPYVPSPLLCGGKLYFLQVNTGNLTCFNAETGKPFYSRQTLEGIKGVYASPVSAAGRVYLAGRNGVVQVIKLGSEYEVLATNSLDDSFSASPAIKDKEIYLRGHKYLYCICEE